MRLKIKLLMVVTVLLIGGGAVVARAESTRHTVDTNEHEWTMNHSDKGHEFNLRIKGKRSSTKITAI